jgi:hypothetical protein
LMKSFCIITCIAIVYMGIIGKDHIERNNRKTWIEDATKNIHQSLFDRYCLYIRILVFVLKITNPWRAAYLEFIVKWRSPS